MNGKGALALVGFLLLISSAGALFDAETLGTLLRGGIPGGVDLTRIVRCTSDQQRPFDVTLIQADLPDGITWLPETPDYIQLPSDLDCINTNFDVIRGLVPELQDINMIVQKLSASEVDLDSDIGPESDARLAIDRICNSINDPATDIDSPLVIVDDTIIRVTNQSNVTGITFSTERLATTAFDQRNVMEDLFASMQCGVLYRYYDLGPAFLPRFMLGGRCLRRSCSFPINGGQTCRADLTEIFRFPGLRYDCCWDYNVERQKFEFDCGWRRVNIPILCDCDCACPRRDVSTG